MHTGHRQLALGTAQLHGRGHGVGAGDPYSIQYHIMCTVVIDIVILIM